ncbi:PREDICTED: tripartite motif-containing protein 7-like, partial [Gekko japonicus]|uniref:Tripartite motif-containing protein 7-like n=1 Tax=Gekko japonicus TaxID=146911 RepID=A0ABM1LFT9_GEKJA
GLGNILQRCNKEKFLNPGAFPLELKQEVENVSKIHPFLETTMNEFKETVLAGPEAKEAKLTVSGTCTVPTLVVLANDYSPNVHSFGTRPNVHTFGTPNVHSFSTRQQWGNSYQNPSQFSCWSYVMGIERINSGSCSWVMNITNEKFWAVGVALESFRGRNVSGLTPEQGIWAVGQSNGSWYAFTSAGTHRLTCPWSSNQIHACPINPCYDTTIQVSLNHEQGSVTFLNADNTAMYTFHNASFSGQPISSWYFVGK